MSSSGYSSLLASSSVSSQANRSMSAPQVLGVVHCNVALEQARVDETGVLAEHEEHDARAQDGQRVVALLAVGVVVEPGDLGVDAAHDAAGLHGDGARHARRSLARPLQELQSGDVLGQILQRDLEQRLVGAQGVALAVVDADGGEVAGNDVARLLAERETDRVAATLLGRGHHAALALLGLVKVDAERFLLHERRGGRDEDVDVAGVPGPRVGHDRFLEPQPVERVIEPQNVLEQVDPVKLGLLVLVAATRPALGERLRVFSLSRH